MKKLVLCVSVFCSLEAYAVDREGISDFFEAGTALMQNCNYVMQLDIENNIKDEEESEEESYFIKKGGEMRLIIENNDYEYDAHLAITSVIKKKKIISPNSADLLSLTNILKVRMFVFAIYGIIRTFV